MLNLKSGAYSFLITDIVLSGRCLAQISFCPVGVWLKSVLSGLTENLRPVALLALGLIGSYLAPKSTIETSISMSPKFENFSSTNKPGTAKVGAISKGQK